jgi:hypothetical protein
MKKNQWLSIDNTLRYLHWKRAGLHDRDGGGGAGGGGGGGGRRGAETRGYGFVDTSRIVSVLSLFFFLNF